MSFVAIAFYVFAGVAIAGAVLVISARNPVHSVLFLILTFFSTAGLFVLLGAEFLAMLLVVVYVGAVAVLFLFVVMMLDVDFVELRQGMMNNVPQASTVSVILFLELLLIFGARGSEGTKLADLPVGQVSNTRALGNLIYDDYFFLFQTAGMILLVAMIGAIVLTLHHREGIKRQNIAEQVARTRDEAVELVDVKPGQGI